MGKFNIFYEQLKAKMAGDPPMSLQEAAAALRAELEKSGPIENEQKERNDRIREQQNDLVLDPNGQDEDARRRLDYSKKCGSALIGCAAEKLKKEAAWDASVKRIAKMIFKPGLTVSGGSGDWLMSLMRTEDTLKNRAYNDRIVMQMALCTGSISMMDGYSVCNYYLANHGNRLRKAERPAREDVENAPQDLLRLLDGQIEKGRQQMAEFESGADVILSGEADEETLSAAFEVIEADEVYLLQNAQNCLNDFKGFEKTLPKDCPNRLPAEELEKREKEWPIPGKKQTDELRERTEQMADPNPAVEKEQEQPAEENKIEENKAEQPRISKEAERFLLRNRTIDEHLKRYGLAAIEKLWTNESGYTVYSNKAGDTIIMKVDEVQTENGPRYEISDDEPGRYVDYDLDERTRLLKLKCKNFELEEPHSAEYDDLNKKMAALEGLKLGDRPTPEHTREVGEKFEAFKASLENFIKAQKGRPLQVTRKWYDETTKELTGFAKEKTGAIKEVAAHLATKYPFELEGKETEAALDSMAKKSVRTSVFDRSVDRYIAAAKEWSEKIANVETIGDYKMMFTKMTHSDEVGDQWDRRIVKGLLGDKAFAGARSYRGVSTPKKVFVNDLGPEEIADALGKSALAGGVVKELLEVEKEMCGEDKHPIRDMIDSGRVAEVAEMVKNSRSFGENYRPLDLSKGSKEKIDEILKGKAEDVAAPREVAKEIMKSYLDRERQADREAQQKPQAQPAAEQPKAQAQPKLPNQ